MLPHLVQSYIETHQLLEPGEGVVVGVSGGVDSVVLLHVLYVLGYVPRIAHVNFGLRPGEADADEAFVAGLCTAMGVPFYARRVDTRAFARAENLSLQAAARALRYAFFDSIAAEAGVRKVAVGHHRDDQAETVLLNLFRGAGLEGLAGMPPSRPLQEGSPTVLVRPLLAVSRADIEAYARARKLAWRTDLSNAGMKYRRNALRNEVMPLIEERFGPDVGARVAQAASVLQAYIRGPFRRCLADDLAACTRETQALDVACLQRHPAPWRRRLLLEALARWLPGAPRRAATAEALDALSTAQTGRRLIFPGGMVWRDRARLRFIPASDGDRDSGIIRVDAGTPVMLEDGVLQVDVLPEAPDEVHQPDPCVEYVDAERLSFPLILRPWRAGDRFSPLGMSGRKKISDLLTDMKVPAHRRKHVRVLCAGDEIVWVVGFRLSEPFRVHPETRRYARLSYSFPVKSSARGA